jgi:hypothetical protein
LKSRGVIGCILAEDWTVCKEDRWSKKLRGQRRHFALLNAGPSARGEEFEEAGVPQDLELLADIFGQVAVLGMHSGER